MGGTDNGSNFAPLRHLHYEADFIVEVLRGNEEGLEANDEAYERPEEASDVEEAGCLEDGS